MQVNLIYGNLFGYYLCGCFFHGLVAVGNFTINSAELCKDLIQEKATQRFVGASKTLHSTVITSADTDEPLNRGALCICHLLLHKILVIWGF